MALKLAPVQAAPGEHGSDHPLLAATIGTLPAIGQPFNATARANWIAMIGMAFNVVYGPEDAMPVQPTTAMPALAAVPAPQPPPTRPAHEMSGCDYYIDAEGFALCDIRREGNKIILTPGRRVLPEEAMDTEIYDYRGPRRDRDTIIWADESQGAQPGMNFCGPG